MKLRLIDNADAELIGEWMSQEENYQWVDFGAGHQSLTPINVRIMMQRDIHVIRVFTPEMKDLPIGVVALSDIDRKAKTASLWYVLGDKRFAGRGYTARAASKILGEGFIDLGLQSVYAWTVDCNVASIRILERNKFRMIGRRRECHYLSGQIRDRLLFDLLASEYREL
jgi:RimJ/RimL family protein N-acetyltransferase